MNIETRADLADLMRTTVVSFTFTPIVIQHDDGSWAAHYPGADWSVSADDEEAARQRLRATEQDRMRDPDAVDWQVAAVRKHLSEGPIPGVYELDAETTARIRDNPDEAELDATLAEAGRRRSNGIGAG